jgi:hypothetical protein
MPPLHALLVAALVAHMLLVQYVMAGTAYLACGRFMGPRRCAVCGWQAILLFSLPQATGLAIVSGLPPLGLLWLLRSQPPIALQDVPWARWLLVPPVLMGCLGLMFLQKSAWITRRSWFWRIPVAAGAFAGCAYVAASWTESHLLTLGAGHDSAQLLSRLGVTFFTSFTTLAISLAWQGGIAGMRLDQPPALAEVVVGLSPVRRLALTALSGVAGGTLMTVLFTAGPPLPAGIPDTARGSLGGLPDSAWSLAAALGMLTQAICWITAALRDRLTTRLLAVTTAACLITVTSGVALRETIRSTHVDTARVVTAHIGPTAAGTEP